MTNYPSYTAEEINAHRALWIEALESGKYQQAQKQLRKDGAGTPQFCCLGVACDVVLKEEPELAEGWFWEGEWFTAADMNDGYDCQPPDWVQEYFGIDDSFYLTGQMWDVADYLAWMNDTANANFKEIAEWLRERPAGRPEGE